MSKKVFEIEMKAPCDDLEIIERRLRDRGASFISCNMEEDVYYNSPARDLRSTDEALRVRRCNGSTILTYKGPKVDPLSKTRLEIEVHVMEEDAQTLHELLSRLGFWPAGVVKKQRRTFQLRGISICLDQVHGLGSFVECEIRHEDIEGKRNELVQLMDALGLEGSVRLSYLELLQGK